MTGVVRFLFFSLGENSYKYHPQRPVTVPPQILTPIRLDSRFEIEVMASITSVELNYLIFRYLQESGFTHTAFAFGYEAGLNKSSIEGNLVPPGALVKFVQKGLQYVEMEANMSNAETDVDEDFSFLQPLDLITKDANELYKIVKDKKNNQHEARGKELDGVNEGATDHVKDNEGKDKAKKAREKKG